MEKTGEQILGELLTEAQALVLKVAAQRDAWRAAAEAWYEAYKDSKRPCVYYVTEEPQAVALRATTKARALEEE